MADVNLTQEEFLTYEGLGYFKQKQDALNDQKDAKVLKDAKDYFDGRVDEFDPAGTGATEAGKVQSNLTKEENRAKEAEQALADRATALEETVTKLDGADTVEGSVKAQIKSAKEELAVNIADAKKAGTDAQSAVNTLSQTHTEDKNALVAKDTELQGEIDAVETDMGDVDALSTTNKTVVGAINEVLAAVGTGGTAAVVTVTTDVTSDGALKSYTIKQGETTVGVIDIPKDMVVEAGEVVTNPDGQPAGTYIKLVLANVAEPLYINVGTLVDIYKAKENATQVQLAIDPVTREISATIVAGSIGTTELADGAITTVKIADANVTLAKLSASLQTSIAKADAAAPQTALDTEVQARKDADTALDNRVKVVEEKAHEHAFDEEVLNGITSEKVAAWDSAEANAEKHADDLNTAMDGRVGTLEGDMTQAKTDIDAVEEAVSKKVEQTVYDAKMTALEGEDTAIKGRLDAIEEAMGEGGSVGTQIDNKIAGLDADVTSAEVESGKGLRVQVVETDGKVASVAVTGNFDNSYDAKGAADTAKSEAIASAAEDATTKANQAETNAKAEVTALANGAVADNAQAIADIQAAMPTAITNEQIDSLFATV